MSREFEDIVVQIEIQNIFACNQCQLKIKRYNDNYFRHGFRMLSWQ